MGRELGFNLRCCAKSCVIQDIEILLHGTRRIVWVDGTVVPIFLRRRVLFVRISLDQTGICSKALPAHQTIRDAPRNSLLEQMPQEFTFSKAPVTVLGKG